MAKLALQSIYDISKFLKIESLLPIYFLCGEDSFTINAVLETIEKTVSPLIESDFDKEVITADKSTDVSGIFNLALSFPFGGGKKLIILKNFDLVKEKKLLTEYLNHPAEFTILIILYNAIITEAEKSREPFLTLIKNNYLFEAKNLVGDELVNWFVKITKKESFELSIDHAKTIIEIVGENKSLLEIQLQKFKSYAQDKNSLSLEELIKLSSPTKEYTIFDFIDAFGKGNKAKALEIGFNLLNAGNDIVFIINMVAKFILTVSQILDLTRQKINDKEAAQRANVSYYYYLNCKKANYFLNDDRLHNAAKALLNADILVKSTSLDNKSILQALIVELVDQVSLNPFEN